MNKILIKRLNKNLPLPKYETAGSSGLDIYADIDDDQILKPGEHRVVPTGIALAVSKGYEIQVRPRSGLAAKNGISIVNSPGTIDADYRGEIKVILINLGKDNFKIIKHTRIAQMVMCPVINATIEEVEDLSQTERGEGGFGSTGIK